MQIAATCHTMSISVLCVVYNIYIYIYYFLPARLFLCFIPIPTQLTQLNHFSLCCMQPHQPCRPSTCGVIVGPIFVHSGDRPK